MLGSLRLPAIILASGSPATAAGTNIAVSAASALTGAIAHARAGRVDWRIAAWMTPPSVAAAFLGAAFFAALRVAGLAVFFAAVFFLAAGFLATFFFVSFLADFFAAALPAGFFVAFFAGFLRAMTQNPFTVRRLEGGRLP